MSTPPITESAIAAAFEECVKLGLAAAKVEERHLSPKPGRSDRMGAAVLAFVAYRETVGVPEPYRVLGNYLARLGHYLGRIPDTDPRDLVAAMAGLGGAIGNNPRYLVTAEMMDEVWKRNIAGSAA